MVRRRIAKMAWYTTRHVKHGNSPFPPRLEVIAIGTKKQQKRSPLSVDARRFSSLLVVLFQAESQDNNREMNQDAWGAAATR
jgi:hypothetical protein